MHGSENVKHNLQVKRKIFKKVNDVVSVAVVILCRKKAMGRRKGFANGCVIISHKHSNPTQALISFDEDRRLPVNNLLPSPSKYTSIRNS
jgi:hypothetical protein